MAKYLGNRPTAVPLTSADIQDGVITTADLGANSVDSSELVDNSVTLAKMAGLARGKLIYGDASGDPAALAVGAADEVLTHDGTDFDWAAVSSGGFLGDGQTWQDVSGSRVSGTYYTNSTGKPIQIFAIYGNVGTGADIKFYYTPDGGSELAGAGLYTNSSSGRQSMTFTIPDGDQYKILGTGGETEQQWWELR